MKNLKQLTFIAITLFAINAKGQQEQKTSSFQHKRDVGRKAVIDTTVNEVVNGKYKALNKTPKQPKPVVIIEKNKDIKQLTYNQNKAGRFLIDARKKRVESLIWMGSCSAIGSLSIAIAKGRPKGVNFGLFVFALGGTVSMVKVVQAFNKIGEAGKALIIK